MKKLKLTNAMQVSVERPLQFELFEIEKEYKNLKIGDAVKVILDKTVFWFIVDEIINFQYIICVAIFPEELKESVFKEYDIAHGDKIELSFENVCDIVKTEEMKADNEMASYIMGSTLLFRMFLNCVCGRCNDPIFINAYNEYNENIKRKEEEKRG